MIALIDYGAGNLTSVRKGFAAVGAELSTPRSPADLARARAIVVPGVGHFQATLPLGGEWRDAILRAVADDVALFGICLGLQWLFESSAEAEEVPGLGFMSGRCEAKIRGTCVVPWAVLASAPAPCPDTHTTCTAKAPAGAPVPVMRLHLASTTVADVDILVPLPPERANGTSGLMAFQFLPVP